MPRSQVISLPIALVVPSSMPALGDLPPPIPINSPTHPSFRPPRFPLSSSLLAPPPLPPTHVLSAEIAVALFGGIVGGIAAGFLWSAQGAYFALNAKKYAIHAGVSASEANDKFASIFASIFLGLEVALKLLPAALTPLSHDSLTIWGGKGKSVNLRDLIIASLYSILAVGAVFVLQRIEELEEERSEEEDTPQPSSLQQDDKQAALLRVPRKASSSAL